MNYSYIAQNRAINQNNVKKHVVSLKEFGHNLVPMLYVNASEVPESCTLIDAETGEKVTDRTDYKVIIDGQHRWAAALQLSKMEKDKQGAFAGLEAMRWEHAELNDKTFSEVLTEINTVGMNWRGADHVSKYLMENPENEVYQFARELTNDGMSAKSAAKIIFFAEKFSWAKPKDGELDKADLPRAKAIWTELKAWPKKFRKTSILIDYVYEEQKQGRSLYGTTLERISKIAAADKVAMNEVKTNGEMKTAFAKLMEKV